MAIQLPDNGSKPTESQPRKEEEQIMSSIIGDFFSLSDRELSDFMKFKKQHIPCSQTQIAFDMIPDDCFSYHYYPNTLGGLIEVECVCGASWVSMDGDFYIREVPPPKEIKDEELIILIVNQLLNICKRPRMFFRENPLAQWFCQLKNGPRHRLKNGPLNHNEIPPSQATRSPE